MALFHLLLLEILVNVWLNIFLKREKVELRTSQCYPSVVPLLQWGLTHFRISILSHIIPSLCGCGLLPLSRLWLRSGSDGRGSCSSSYNGKIHFLLDWQVLGQLCISFAVAGFVFSSLIWLCVFLLWQLYVHIHLWLISEFLFLAGLVFSSWIQLRNRPKISPSSSFSCTNRREMDRPR